MDTTALVENLIADGQELLDRLRQEGFQVTAAFWLRPAEDGEWHFYIASPTVEKEGLAQGYRRLHSITRRMPQPFWIDPLEMKLIGESHPITKDVLAVLSRAAGPTMCPIRWGGKKLGDVSVEGAYLYPLPAGAGN